MISWLWLIPVAVVCADFGVAIGMACAAAGQAERCEECRKDHSGDRTDMMEENEL